MLNTNLTDREYWLKGAEAAEKRAERYRKLGQTKRAEREETAANQYRECVANTHGG